jgi:hypothetical protein
VINVDQLLGIELMFHHFAASPYAISTVSALIVFCETWAKLISDRLPWRIPSNPIQEQISHQARSLHDVAKCPISEAPKFTRNFAKNLTTLCLLETRLRSKTIYC